MLLENNTQVLFAVDVILVFDNSTTKRGRSSSYEVYV